jgi:hypothetical protein
MVLGNWARPERKADNLTAICEPIAWTISEPGLIAILHSSTACYMLRFPLLCVDDILTSQEAQVWASTAFYGDSFAFICISDVRTSQEAHVWAPTACYASSFTFLYIQIIFVPHRKHKYRPLRPVTGDSCSFCFFIIFLIFKLPLALSLSFGSYWQWGLYCAVFGCALRDERNWNCVKRGRKYLAVRPILSKLLGGKEQSRINNGRKKGLRAEYESIRTLRTAQCRRWRGW